MEASILDKKVKVTGPCCFCNNSDDDETKFGVKIEKKGIIVHYFCMLFSSGLCQRGSKDTHGILGFMLSDIQKELKRGTRLKCHFCNLHRATIGCCNKKCRLSFHFPCARDNQALFQYYGSYMAYCIEHRPQQPPPTLVALTPLGKHKKTTTQCPICMLNISRVPGPDVLYSPCCRDAWFHRECIQRHASSAGTHFFRCPLCNNNDTFQNEMLTYGIYIPDQDASWEKEPHAFEELLQRHSRCDVRKCVCKQGRDHNLQDSPWEIVLCDMCGSAGCHMKCAGLKTAADDWVCEECSSILGAVGSSKLSAKFKTKKYLNSFAQSNPNGKPCLSKKRPGETLKGQMAKRRKFDIASTIGKYELKECSILLTRIDYNLQVPIYKQNKRRVVKTGKRRLKDSSSNKRHIRSPPKPADIPDLTDRPDWLRQLMQDDIFTGENLGKAWGNFVVKDNSKPNAAIAASSTDNSEQVPSDKSKNLVPPSHSVSGESSQTGAFTPETNKVPATKTESASSSSVSATAHASSSKTLPEGYDEASNRLTGVYVKKMQVPVDTICHDKPRWFKKLLTEDIITGNNVGVKNSGWISPMKQMGDESRPSRLRKKSVNTPPKVKKWQPLSSSDTASVASDQASHTDPFVDPEISFKNPIGCNEDFDDLSLEPNCTLALQSQEDNSQKDSNTKSKSRLKPKSQVSLFIKSETQSVSDRTSEKISVKQKRGRYRLSTKPRSYKKKAEILKPQRTLFHFWGTGKRESTDSDNPSSGTDFESETEKDSSLETVVAETDSRLDQTMESDSEKNENPAVNCLSSEVKVVQSEPVTDVKDAGSKNNSSLNPSKTYSESPSKKAPDDVVNEILKVNDYIPVELQANQCISESNVQDTNLESKGDPTGQNKNQGVTLEMNIDKGEGSLGKASEPPELALPIVIDSDTNSEASCPQLFACDEVCEISDDSGNDEGSSLESCAENEPVEVTVCEPDMNDQVPIPTENNQTSVVCKAKVRTSPRKKQIEAADQNSPRCSPRKKQSAPADDSSPWSTPRKKVWKMNSLNSAYEKVDELFFRYNSPLLNAESHGLWEITPDQNITQSSSASLADYTQNTVGSHNLHPGSLEETGHQVHHCSEGENVEGVPGFQNDTHSEETSQNMCVSPQNSHVPANVLTHLVSPAESGAVTDGPVVTGSRCTLESLADITPIVIKPDALTPIIIQPDSLDCYHHEHEQHTQTDQQQTDIVDLTGPEEEEKLHYITKTPKKLKVLETVEWDEETENRHFQIGLKYCVETESGKPFCYGVVCEETEEGTVDTWEIQLKRTAKQVKK